MADTRLVLLIQIDALRGDYLVKNDASFLAHLARQSITGRLQPIFGFEPDGAYLAGLYPDECDGGTHYWFEPQTSPFQWYKYLAPIQRLFPKGIPQKTLRNLLTFIVRKTTRFEHDTVANIPFDLLRQFSPATNQSQFNDGFAAYPTLFSLCSDNGIEWLRHSSPLFKTKVDNGVLRLKRELKPPIHFAFWHISNLDTAGHRYGPRSSECAAAMREVDAGIHHLFEHLKGLYDRIDLVVIGDHGMAEVRETLDVHKSLHEAGIRQGHGVLYFLDSTMARFWFFDKGAKSQVIFVLEKLRGGRILRQGDLDLYHLNYPHNRFGDLFFLADPGVLILPNFYQGTAPVKGMHGYAPECPEQQSAFIIYSPGIAAARRIEQPVDMRRVFPTVLKLLGLENLSTCQLESII